MMAAMIRTKRRDDAMGEKLLPSKALYSSDAAEGLDIKRKASRKGKKLIMLPGLLAPTAEGGDIGDLENLDGETPTLTVTFPGGGRMRFIGRVLHPDQRFLHISMEKKEASCKDVFQSMVVFDESRWLGTKEENPEDAALELPAEIKQWQRQTEHGDSTTFHHGCSSRAISSSSAVSSGIKRRAKPSISVIDDDDDDDDDDDNDNSPPASQDHASDASQRRSGRARKTVDYRGQDDEDKNFVVLSSSDEDGDESNDDDEDDEDDEVDEEEVAKPVSKKMKRAVKSDTVKRVEAPKKQVSKKPAPSKEKRGSSRPRRSSASGGAYKEVDSDVEDQDEDEEDDDDDEEEEEYSE